MKGRVLRRLTEPRVAIGTLLVAGSVWLGITVQGSADAGGALLVASRDLAAGTQLSRADVEPATVLIDSPDRYLSDFGEGGVLLQPVAAGELVPARAVAPMADLAPTRQVALAVDAARLPPGLARGSGVDVWVTDETGTTSLVLAAAPVVALSDPDQWAGATATVSVLVPAEEVAAVLRAARTGSVDLSAVASR